MHFNFLHREQERHCGVRYSAETSWYYPYHYAPFASDLYHSFTLKTHFDMGQPLRPFSQLSAMVFPGSVHALSQAYSELVLSPSSVIGDFFPEDFALDSMGRASPTRASSCCPSLKSVACWRHSRSARLL